MHIFSMRKSSTLFLILFYLLNFKLQVVCAADAKTANPTVEKKQNDTKSSEKAVAEAMPVGRSKTVFEVNSTKLDVFTYKPKNYKDGPLIIVCHGLKRAAELNRDNAIELADRTGAILAAPLFDEARFPTRLYQHGGIYTEGLKAAPKAEWTWSLLHSVIDQVRKHEGKPDMPYYLLGHSAGGQFLVRYAGFMKTDAKRIVAANPGTELFPNTEHSYPYGFGKLPDELKSDEAIRKYLAQPLTIYLGTADVEKAENLDQSERANLQGPNRYERGKKVFSLAQELAKKNKWEFNWKLVEAKDVAHSAKDMYGNPACEKALFGEK